jgi:hypothetical protein
MTLTPSAEVMLNCTKAFTSPECDALKPGMPKLCMDVDESEPVLSEVNERCIATFADWRAWASFSEQVVKPAFFSAEEGQLAGPRNESANCEASFGTDASELLLVLGLGHCFAAASTRCRIAIGLCAG